MAVKAFTSGLRVQPLLLCVIGYRASQTRYSWRSLAGNPEQESGATERLQEGRWSLSQRASGCQRQTAVVQVSPLLSSRVVRFCANVWKDCCRERERERERVL